MSRLTLVAEIHATPGRGGDALTLLQALVPSSRAEAGCLHYDLYPDANDDHHFLFHETWESRAAWDTHNATPHVAELQRASEGMLTVALFQLTPIEP